MRLSPISHRLRTLAPSTAASNTDFSTPVHHRGREGGQEREEGREKERGEKYMGEGEKDSRKEWREERANGRDETRKKHRTLGKTTVNSGGE